MERKRTQVDKGERGNEKEGMREKGKRDMGVSLKV